MKKLMELHIGLWPSISEASWQCDDLAAKTVLRQPAVSARQASNSGTFVLRLHIDNNGRVLVLAQGARQSAEALSAVLGPTFASK